MEQPNKFWVGIDWGSETHHVCVLDERRERVMERAVAHSAKGLRELVEELLSLGPSSSIGVAIETPRGAVVEALIERAIAVYAINPKQLDRFRDRHTAAGAKDDRRDAFVLAHSLSTDTHCFRRVVLGDALLVQLRELTRLHEDLAHERTMLANRLGDQLRRYFPQVLELGSIYDEPWLWALLRRAPTPAQAKRLSLAKVGSILTAHRIRRLTPEQVRQVLSSDALPVAPGVTQAAVMHVTALLARLRLVHNQDSTCDKRMKQLLDGLCATPAKDAPDDKKREHRDAAVLRSLPGVGTIVSATMLSEASQALAARDYASLRALSGIAPVTRASGKRTGKQASVSMRYACNTRLRNALHHWADNSVKRDARSKQHYARLRAKGHSHGRALRGVADRLLAMLVAMLRTGSSYRAARPTPEAEGAQTISLPTA